MSTSISDSDAAAGQQSLLETPTFGVELEAIAYTPSNVNASAYARRALLQPISIQCPKPGCGKVHTWRLPVHDGSEDDYTKWQFDEDISVMPTDGEVELKPRGFRYGSMELVSRVLNFDRPTSCPFGQTYPCTSEPFEWEWRVEVDEVLKALHVAFSHPGYRLLTNRSTGLHVHIGNGEGRPHAKTAFGMFGAFAALERLVDQILPVSRIQAYRGTSPTPSIHTQYSMPQDQDTRLGNEWQDREYYGGCISNVMFCDLERIVKGQGDMFEYINAYKINRIDIKDGLTRCNVPAWLGFISQQTDISTFMSWWPRYNVGRLVGKRCAVNLANLQGEYDYKKTIELRAHQGSIDVGEITAWIDLMSSLALWISNPDIKHDTFLLGAWADPNASIVDVAREVGSAESTIAFYTDRLTADWAERRFKAAKSAIRNPDDKLNALTIKTEENRFHDHTRANVDARIQHKLESGRYGQLPSTLLKAKLPQILQTRIPDVFLKIDSCDYEQWTDAAIRYYENQVALLDQADREWTPQPLNTTSSPPRARSDSPGQSPSRIPICSRTPTPPAAPSPPQRVLSLGHDLLDDPFSNAPDTIQGLTALVQREIDNQGNNDDDDDDDDDDENATSDVASDESFPMRATDDNARTFAVPGSLLDDSPLHS